MLVGRQQHDVSGVRYAGGEGVQAALQIEGRARIVEQGNSRHADQNAEYVLAVLLGFQEDELPQHHDRRIDEMEYRGRAGLDVVVGAEKQKRGQTAAHKGDKAQAGQSLDTQAYPSLAAERQHRKQGQRQEIAQKRKCDGVDPVGIDQAGHQRHKTENHRAEYDAYVALEQLSVIHKRHPKSKIISIYPVFKFGFIGELKIEIVGADVLDGPISTR